MSNWVNSYVYSLFRYRWLVLLLTALVSAAVISGVRFLEFKSDYRVFFGEENPQLKAFDALQCQYTKADIILFVI